MLVPSTCLRALLNVLRTSTSGPVGPEIPSGARLSGQCARLLTTGAPMSDDTITVELEIDREMLSAMRRVRRQQRTDRDTRTAELSEETPAKVVSKLLMRGYGDELRRARTRGASGGPVGADASYSSE